MQQVIESNVVVRRVRAARGLAAKCIDPLGHPRIEVGVQAHLIKDSRAGFHDARENVVDVVDGESVVGTVVAHGTLRTGADSVPKLLVTIPLTAEQQVLAVFAAGREHRH